MKIKNVLFLEHEPHKISFGKGGEGGFADFSGSFTMATGKPGGPTSLGDILTSSGGHGGKGAVHGDEEASFEFEWNDSKTYPDIMGIINKGFSPSISAIQRFSNDIDSFRLLSFISGRGGSSWFGNGGEPVSGISKLTDLTTSIKSGSDGDGYGAGGSGAAVVREKTARGGNGSDGCIYIEI